MTDTAVNTLICYSRQHNFLLTCLASCSHVYSFHWALVWATYNQHTVNQVVLQLYVINQVQQSIDGFDYCNKQSIVFGLTRCIPFGTAEVDLKPWLSIGIRFAETSICGYEFTLCDCDGTVLEIDGECLIVTKLNAWLCWTWQAWYAQVQNWLSLHDWWSLRMCIVLYKQ